MIINAIEQEFCEDEYIKVPKRALKYRTAGMVAYNAEWLKNHFDIERAVICGAQEPKIKVLDRDEAIRRLVAVDIYETSAWDKFFDNLEYLKLKVCEVEE